MSTNALFLAFILGGCFLNNVVLELIILQDKGAGALMTLFQFIFVAAVGIHKHVRFTGSLYRPISFSSRAPVTEYLKLTALFFAISVANNKAFEYGISQPFNVVFRSSSLLVSFLVGYFGFNQSYSWTHFVSVMLVTTGVLVTTMAEVSAKSSLGWPSSVCCGPDSIVTQLWTAVSETPQHSVTSDGHVYRWLIGTFLLFSTLIGLAFLGHLQNSIYRKYGSSADENMFFSHLLPIPLFLLIAHDLLQHLRIWNSSRPLQLVSFLPSIPSLWFLCVLNVLTQWICIVGVYQVTAAMGTLTATLATTIRKFLSLIFSVLYFQNAFSTMHWYGSALVFVGSFLYIAANQSPNIGAQKKAN